MANGDLVLIAGLLTIGLSAPSAQQKEPKRQKLADHRSARHRSPCFGEEAARHLLPCRRYGARR